MNSIVRASHSLTDCASNSILIDTFGTLTVTSSLIENMIIINVLLENLDEGKNNLAQVSEDLFTIKKEVQNGGQQTKFTMRPRRGVIGLKDEKTRNYLAVRPKYPWALTLLQLVQIGAIQDQYRVETVVEIPEKHNIRELICRTIIGDIFLSDVNLPFNRESELTTHLGDISLLQCTGNYLVQLSQSSSLRYDKSDEIIVKERILHK